MTDWSGFKVLVVDDQRFMINIVIRFLNELGVPVDNVYQAASGTEAIAILNKTKIDIVLCDINMSPGNGLKLLQQIRTRGCNAPAEIPFVFITGHADDQTVKAAIELDASGFIVKPISLNAIRSKVSHALTSRIRPKRRRDYLAVRTSLSRAVRESAAFHGNASPEEEDG